MNIRSAAFAAGFAGLTLLSIHAQDAAGTTYARVDLGGNFIQEVGFHLPSVPATGELEMEPGVGLFGAFGYYLTDNLAVELETGFTFNSLGKLKIAGVTVPNDGDYYQAPLLGNLVLALPNETIFTPFLGIGVGGILSQLDQRTFFGNDGDTDINLAAQVFGGVRYAINDRVDATLGYKLLAADKPSYSIQGARVDFDEHLLSHSITLGFKVNF